VTLNSAASTLGELRPPHVASVHSYLQQCLSIDSRRYLWWTSFRGSELLLTGRADICNDLSCAYILIAYYVLVLFIVGHI